eukprot:1514273-Rhodomonas_salina.1
MCTTSSSRTIPISSTRSALAAKSWRESTTTSSQCRPPRLRGSELHCPRASTFHPPSVDSNADTRTSSPPANCWRAASTQGSSKADSASASSSAESESVIPGRTEAQSREPARRRELARARAGSVLCWASTRPNSMPPTVSSDANVSCPHTTHPPSRHMRAPWLPRHAQRRDRRWARL